MLDIIKKRGMKICIAAAVFLAVSIAFGGPVWADDAYIPHITGGEAGWTDYLQVNNNGSSSASFTVYLYNGGTQVHSSTHNVAAYGHTELDIKTALADAETGKVSYSSEALTFRISYVYVNGGVAEFVLPDTLYDTMGIFFSDFVETVQAKGAAVSNLSDATIDVTLYAVGDGEILDSYDTTIGPYGKLVENHAAWFPSITTEQIKSILVEASDPGLSGVVISSDFDASFLLFTPGRDVSVSGVGEYYLDADGDGYGDENQSTSYDSSLSGYVSNSDDCDDNDADIHPGATEVCNGEDDDCDGDIDEGDVCITCYRDADGDGYGDPGITTQAATCPGGYVSNDDDCDDTRADVYPGAEEVADGVDNDCDGDIDEGCGG